MKKIITFISLTVLALALAGCNHFQRKAHYNQHARPQEIPAKYVQNKKNVKLKQFDSIVYDGRFDLDIRAETGKYQISMKGEGNIRDSIMLRVSDGTLHVKSVDKKEGKPDSKPTPLPKLRINMKRLVSVKVAGSGKVKVTNASRSTVYVDVSRQTALYMTGKSIGLRRLDVATSGNVLIKNLNSNRLVVNANNSGRLTLRGRVGLKRFNYNGSGVVDISGVNTRSLFADVAGSGYVKLIGHVGLKKLNYSGSGELMINKSYNKGIAMNIGGTGNVTLIGTVGIEQLNYQIL